MFIDFINVHSLSQTVDREANAANSARSELAGILVQNA
jgi:hypothetical protein